MSLSDAMLEDIDRYLLKVISEERGLQFLYRAAEIDLDQYNLDKLWLFRQFTDNSVYYKGLDYFFAYSAVNDDFVFAPKPTGHAYTDNQPIQQGIASLIKKDSMNQGYSNLKWTAVNLDGSFYLIHIIRSGSVYIGAGVNANDVMGPLDLLNLGTKGKALFVDANDKPFQDEEFFIENKINLTNKSDLYYLTGQGDKYLVTGKQSAKGDFRLLAVIPDDMILENLPYLQRIILFIVFGSAFVLAATLVFLRKVILYPVNRLVSAMRRVKQGNLGQRIDLEPSSNEFELMNETFNSMVSEIEQLKINVYEEQLISQKAELKHLQLQINPHFFLNSLNVVYYLAQESKVGLIQELSYSLIRYFRFMFRTHTNFVDLHEELEHTENYLKIQEIRFPGSVTYNFSVQEGLADCYVPPLMIQTFAENTIKHAIDTDGTTHIDIMIHANKEEQSLHIRIRDTGKGFSEVVLHKLKQHENLTNEEGEHIGIWNVKRRLLLLYQDQAQIEFSNNGGAVIDILLPYKKEGV